MRSVRARVGPLACSLLFVLFIGQGAAAQGASFDFDIPAQPLAAALERYISITGRNALYNSELVAGRRSTPVRGHLSPEAALSSLLSGTGLAAKQATLRSFAVVSAPPAPQLAQPSPSVAQYYGRIQTSLQRTLCANSDTRPGRYRIAVRLWIDPAGNVTQHERLGSTGTPDQDEGVDHSLRHLRLGAAPPAELMQPVSIVIRPQASGVTMGCEEAAIQGVAP